MAENNNCLVKHYITDLLDEKGFDFEVKANEQCISVELGGNDTSFLSLINIVNDKAEDWTYNLLLNIRIELDLPYETVRFYY